MIEYFSLYVGKAGFIVALLVWGNLLSLPYFVYIAFKENRVTAVQTIPTIVLTIIFFMVFSSILNGLSDDVESKVVVLKQAFELLVIPLSVNIICCLFMHATLSPIKKKREEQTI